jgi:hypothetical protein
MITNTTWVNKPIRKPYLPDRQLSFSWALQLPYNPRRLYSILIIAIPFDNTKYRQMSLLVVMTANLDLRNFKKTGRRITEVRRFDHLQQKQSVSEQADWRKELIGVVVGGGARVVIQRAEFKRY